MTFLSPEIAPLADPDASAEEWLQALSHVLADEMFSNTWTVEAGSACRAVFLFEDGLCLTWVGDGNGGEPAILQAWATADSALFSPGVHNAAPRDCPTPGPFDWNPGTQAWEAEVDSAEAADLISKAVALHGPLKVVLPWEFLTNNEFVESLLALLGQNLPFSAAIASVDESKLAEELAFLEDEEQLSSTLVAAATLGGVVPPIAWGTDSASLVMGDDYLPPSSPLSRFYRFMEGMQDREGWIIVWDECCGTCAGGTYEMLREGEGLPEGSPALFLFGQNAQFSWRPNGFMSYDFYMSDSNHSAIIVQEALKVGLTAHAKEDMVTISG